MLLPLLRNDGHECIYFNAWENDYADDPLIGLLAAVQEQSSSKSAKWARTKKLGGAVAKTIAPVALKIVTHGLLGADDLSGVVTDSEASAIADFAKDVSARTIDEHVKSRKTVLAFKKALAGFATQISQHLDGKTRSLVVVVDELDRCRPTFAIETLERIKHLFNVPNVAFVLAVDLAQLEHSARALYGTGMDAANYLRRFIDLVCDLPSASAEDFCRQLYGQFELEEVLGEEGDFVIRLFSAVAGAFTLSLRAQEQLFAQVAVTARLLFRRAFGAVEISVLMVILRAVNEQLFTQYIKGLRGGAEVLKYFNAQPALARVIDGWPIVDVLLQAYSLIEGEAVTARQDYVNTAQMPNTSPEQRRRAEWASNLFQNAMIGSRSLENIIKPALEFTATVRR